MAAIARWVGLFSIDTGVEIKTRSLFLVDGLINIRRAEIKGLL
jgi:hypothetical protein